MTEPPAQLVFDLGHRPALGRSDFLVSDCNSDAVGWIDSWPDWPAPGLVICGPEACGKSHLGQVWCARSSATEITMADIDEGDPPALVGEHGEVYIDNAGDIAGNAQREQTVLHLYNLIAARDGHVLISARTPPAHWAIALADLRSRLNALPVATIDAPDDQVLGAVLLKLFADRQLKVGSDVLLYAVSRMERSFAAAERLVAALDEAALASQRRVSVALLRQIMPAVETEN